jgi:hypothetical protein
VLELHIRLDDQEQKVIGKDGLNLIRQDRNSRRWRWNNRTWRGEAKEDVWLEFPGLRRRKPEKSEMLQV